MLGSSQVVQKLEVHLLAEMGGLRLNTLVTNKSNALLDVLEVELGVVVHDCGNQSDALLPSLLVLFLETKQNQVVQSFL